MSELTRQQIEGLREMARSCGDNIPIISGHQMVRHMDAMLAIVDERDAFRTALDASERRVAALTEMLRRFEWSGRGQWAESGYCPDCKYPEAAGHWTWCSLAPLLSVTPTPPPTEAAAQRVIRAAREIIAARDHLLEIARGDSGEDGYDPRRFEWETEYNVASSKLDDRIEGLRFALATLTTLSAPAPGSATQTDATVTEERDATTE